MIDVGAGTMDVLYYNAESGLHYKAVVKSPVLYQAEKAASIEGNLLVTGNEMGGGPISRVLMQRAKEADVIMSVSAAVTIHHNLDKVRAWGIKVVADSDARDFENNPKYSKLTVCDLEVDRLRQVVNGFGVPFRFDVVGLCAQDHGMPPPGVSHLDYRHSIFKAGLDQHPYPHALLYKADEVPETFNRLRSLAENAALLHTGEIYVMDSGMAAILGASMDLQGSPMEKLLVLDIATSHTVGAALDNGAIGGFFEYHTQDITLDRLESLLHELANGTLEHQQVLAEGGHGAYLRHALGFDAMDIIVATGPKRRLVENSRLPIRFGAPWGDNMMTGTVGLLEAIRKRNGLPSIRYL
jgi:uncharacterized protein (DUF1786 family)